MSSWFFINITVFWHPKVSLWFQRQISCFTLSAQRPLWKIGKDSGRMVNPHRLFWRFWGVFLFNLSDLVSPGASQTATQLCWRWRELRKWSPGNIRRGHLEVSVQYPWLGIPTISKELKNLNKCWKTGLTLASFYSHLCSFCGSEPFHPMYVNEP